MMKMIYYRYKYYVLLIFIFQFVVNDSIGQSCISGRIVDSLLGKPIQDVNIRLNNLSGTTSDKDGYFKICQLPSDSVTIRITHIGFKSIERHYFLNPGENNLDVIDLNPQIQPIEEFVVTATRTDNRISDIPVRVNMISPSMIKSIPIQTIDEVLRFAPGVNFSRPFGIFSTKSTVTMRGLSGKEQGRILVLYDGIPLNKSDGGTVDWNLIDLSTIQKIEITKGVGSAIYGSNAMGGTINIISKIPDKKFFLNASLEYGTYNTAGGKISTGGRVSMKNPGQSLFWSVNLFYKQSDGYITQSAIDILSNPYIVKSNMTETGIGFKTIYNFSKNHNLETTGNLYNDRRGTGEKVFQPEGNTTDHDSYGFRVNYKGKFGTDKGDIKLFSVLYSQVENYKKVNEYLKDDYTWYNVLSTRSDFGWLNYMTAGFGKTHMITAGFDLKTGMVDAYDKYYTSTDIVFNKGKINTYAGYAQDEIRLFDEKVRLIAGIRYDMAVFYDGAFYIDSPTMETSFMDLYQVPDMKVKKWQALSPRISGQYQWNTNSRVFIGFSRGFRPSVLDDLCRSGRIKGGFKLANPSIKPEYLSNFEAGLDVSPANNLFWSNSIYFSKGNDFQYYVSNGLTIDMGFGDRPIFIRANISKVEIYGLENEVRYSFLKHFSIFANYSFNHSIIDSYHKLTSTDTIDLSGKFFTDVPKHIFSGGISLNSSIVNAGVFVRYTDKMYINDQNVWDEILLSDMYPAYTTVDMRISKRIKSRYQVSLNIQNLLDVKYYDSKYAVCPGRFITGELLYNL